MQRVLAGKAAAPAAEIAVAAAAAKKVTSEALARMRVTFSHIAD
jgi:hypothetical protein